PPVHESVKLRPAKFWIGAGIGTNGRFIDSTATGLFGDSGGGIMLPAGPGNKGRDGRGLDGSAALESNCARSGTSPRDSCGATFSRSYVLPSMSCGQARPAKPPSRRTNAMWISAEPIDFATRARVPFTVRLQVGVLPQVGRPVQGDGSRR